MDKKKPLISFIVTVYNLEDYISKCLESILQQNFDDYEIIVVDNGSTDASYNVCQSYAEMHPEKVKFYSIPKEKAVMGTGHILGFKKASGEYIQYIDGDDRLKENCLPEIANIIYEKKIDIVMGKFECYLEDGTSNKNNFNDADFEASKINDVSYDDALIYLSTLANFQGVFWRYIFKKSVFGENLKDYPYPASIYGDGIMVIKLFLSSNSIYFIDKAIYLYTRRSSGSGMGSFNTKELSRDSIISFLNGLYFLKKLKPKKGKRIYLINKIYFIFKFFKFGLNYVGSNQYIDIAHTLEKSFSLLKTIKLCKIPDLKKLYTYTKKNGCLNGIVLYNENIKINFFSLLRKKNSEKLYIIPSGNKTLSTLKLLKDNDYKVCAIFDNDIKKQGHSYDGYPILSPMMLSELNDSEKKEITIIISAIDETLVDILTKQLNELGIDNSQIVIKE